MADDVRLSVLRRKRPAGLRAAAIGGGPASAVGGRLHPQALKKARAAAVLHRSLPFDVNDSLLNIRHLAALLERLFGDGKLVNEWLTQLIL